MGVVCTPKTPKITHQANQILGEVIFFKVNFKHIIEVFQPQFNSILTETLQTTTYLHILGVKDGNNMQLF